MLGGKALPVQHQEAHFSRSDAYNVATGGAGYHHSTQQELTLRTDGSVPLLITCRPKV